MENPLERWNAERVADSERTGFYGSRTPDGLAITLKVYKDGTLQDEILERSLNGFAKFSLDKDRFPKGVYSFKIETAGLQKSFANISYE